MPRRRTEWQTATLGNILLGLGTILLTIAALVFATVTWQTLSDAQRALVLLGVTVICATGTALLHDRLRNTAEAFGVLFVTFVVIDWYALRRAGVGGDVDVELWWSVGLAIGACVSIGVWFTFAMRVQKAVSPMLATTSAVLLALFIAGTTPSPAASFAVLLSLVAALAVVLGVVTDREPWHLTSVTFTVAASLVGALVAPVALVTLADEGFGLATAIATLAFGVAPATARAIRPGCRGTDAGAALEVLVAIAFTGGIVFGVADTVEGPALFAVAALVALALVLFAAYGPTDLATGPTLTAIVTLAITAIGAVAPILSALTFPLTLVGAFDDGTGGGSAADRLVQIVGRANTDLGSSLSERWVIVVLGCIGVATVIGSVPYGARRRPVPTRVAAVVTLAIATLLVALTPLLLGASVWAVALADLAAGAALLIGTGRVTSGDNGVVPITGTVLAIAAAASGLLWAVLDVRLFTLALGVVLLTTIVASVLTRHPWQREGLVPVGAIAWLALGQSAADLLELSIAERGATLAWSGSVAMLVATYVVARVAAPRWTAWVLGASALFLGTTVALEQWTRDPWIAVGCMALVALTAAVDGVAQLDPSLRGVLFAIGTSAAAVAAGLATAAAGAPDAWGAAVATIVAGVAIVTAMYLLDRWPADRPGLLVGGGATMLIALLAALGGWPDTAPWAAVTAVAVTAIVAAVVAPRTTEPQSRGITVAGAALTLGAASGMAAHALGAPAHAVGLVLAAGGATGLVLSTWVLRATDATLALVQRISLVIATGVVGGSGVLLAYVGTSALATQGRPAQGWADAPWFTVAALGLLGLGAGIASLRAAEEPLRAALLAVATGAGMLEPGLVLAAAGAAAAWAATGVVAAGAATLVATRWLPVRSEHRTLHRTAAELVAVLATSVGLVGALDGWTTGMHRWATVTAIGIVTLMLAAIRPRIVEPIAASAATAAAGALAMVDVALITSAAGGSVPQAALVSALVGGSLIVAAPLVDPGRPRAISTLVPVAYLGTLVALVVAVVGERLVSVTPSTYASGWSTEPWITVAIVAVLVAAPLLALRRTDGDAVWALHLTCAAFALIGEAGLVGAAAGASLGVIATSIAVVAGAVFVGGSGRFGRPVVRDVSLTAGAIGLVGAAATAATAWTAQPWSGVVVAVVIAVSMATTSLLTVRTELRPWLDAAAGVAAIVAAGLVGPAVDAQGWTAGFGAAVASGLALVVACWMPVDERDGRPLEVVALFGATFGAYTTTLDVTAHPEGMAITLTALVPLFAVASLRPGRAHYRWVAAGTALLALWSWCWAADITTPEAYTLPAAVLALGAGIAAHRREPAESSWLLYGPALLLGLGPTLWLALTDTGVVRPVLAMTGAFAVVMVGVWQRLQAPIVLGAIAIVVVAADTIWPIASQAPRWVVFAVAGVLFLWLGATIERRLKQLRNLREGFGHLH